jgi:Holliday junction resolvase RusA-like endonuclease
MREPLFSLFVPGTPRPAGSKNAVPIGRRGGGYVTAANGRPLISVRDSSVHAGAWKARITALARARWPHAPLDVPLVLTLVFTMPRPQSHYGSRKGAPYLKDTAPTWHTSAPDATKLLRCCEDALNELLWTDDRLVVESHVRKVYGAAPGVSIIVRAAETRGALPLTTEPAALSQPA